VSDNPAGGSPPDSDSAGLSQTTRIDRPSADDFRPDVPDSAGAHALPDDPATTALSAPPTRPPRPDSPARPPADYGGDPTREPLAFDPPREPPIETALAAVDVHLIPGGVIANGRYRLLVFHGGPPNLQFWQALDTALDRQVALTFVNPDGLLPERAVQEILARTQRLSRVDMPGVASHQIIEIGHARRVVHHAVKCLVGHDEPGVVVLV